MGFCVPHKYSRMKRILVATSLLPEHGWVWHRAWLVWFPLHGPCPWHVRFRSFVPLPQDLSHALQALQRDHRPTQEYCQPQRRGSVTPQNVKPKQKVILTRNVITITAKCNYSTQNETSVFPFVTSRFLFETSVFFFVSSVFLFVTSALLFNYNLGVPFRNLGQCSFS